MSEPNGINANLANLKCCNPNGIPMIVIHNTRPNAACSNANQKPDTTNHITFNKKEPTPPPYSTSFPNGKKLRLANLKH